MISSAQVSRAISGIRHRARLVRLVDRERVVRDEIAERVGDPLEQGVEALLREDVVEDVGEAPIGVDEGVDTRQRRACGSRHRGTLGGCLFCLSQNSHKPQRPWKVALHPHSTGFAGLPPLPEKGDIEALPLSRLWRMIVRLGKEDGSAASLATDRAGQSGAEGAGRRCGQGGPEARRKAEVLRAGAGSTTLVGAHRRRRGRRPRGDVARVQALAPGKTLLHPEE